MEITLTIIRLIFLTLWVIWMYEVGRKHLSSEIIKNWKNLLKSILLLTFVVFGFITQADSETGIRGELNLDVFLYIFIPTLLALLIGLYSRKKKLKYYYFLTQ